MSTTYTVTNPYNGELLGEYNYAAWPEVLKVVETLKAGRKTQKGITAFQRADILRRLQTFCRKTVKNWHS